MQYAVEEVDGGFPTVVTRNLTRMALQVLLNTQHRPVIRQFHGLVIRQFHDPVIRQFQLSDNACLESQQGNCHVIS